MKHIHEEARRQTENTLADVNRHLANPKIAKNPRNHHMLNDMREKAIRTLDTLDRMDERDDYRETNIGYHDDAEMRHGRRVRVGGYTRRRPRYEADDRYDDYDDYDDMDDIENRRSGRKHRDSKGRFTRSNYDDNRNDDVYPQPYPTMPRQNDRKIGPRTDGAADDRADDRR